MPTEKKISLVNQLKDKFSRAKSVIFTDYSGLSVPAMQELRNKLKEQEADYTVAKNTLIKRAFKEQVAQDVDLEGPTALIISYKDPLRAIKALFDYIKEKQIPTVKSGIFGGALLDAKGVVELSKIPSREGLVGRFVGILDAPLINFVGVLQANQRNMVAVLASIKDAKEN